LPTIQDQPEPIEPILQPNSWPSNNQTIRQLLNGFNNRSPPYQIGKWDNNWCINDRGRSWAYKGGDHDSLFKNSDRRRGRRNSFKPTLQRFGLPDSIISDRDPQFTARSFQNSSNYLESNRSWQQPSTPNLTERQNDSTKKSKLTSGYTAPQTQPTGTRKSLLPNSSITTDGIPTETELPSNWCSEPPPSQFQLLSKTPNSLQ